jgi:hypothetical protein
MADQQKGYANIVRIPNTYRSSVRGLCYLFTPEDEATLYRSEGIPTAYEKNLLDV